MNLLQIGRVRNFALWLAVAVSGGLAVPQAQAQLLRVVEDVNAAGVVRIGNYGDDNVAYYILSSTSFPFFGTAYSGLTVSVNGTLTFGNTGYFTSNPSLLPLPRGSTPGVWAAQDDWTYPDIAAQPRGFLYYKRYNDGYAITWANVRHAPSILGGPTNTFQVYLYDNGDIGLGYDDLNRADGYVVGLNKGNGTYISLTGVNSGQAAFNEAASYASISRKQYLFHWNGTDYTPSAVLPGRTVSGTLILEGIDAAAAAQTITFTFRPADASGDVIKTASVGPGGAFTLTGLPARNYTLHIKGDRYLASNVAVNASSGDVTNVSATLHAGDANNDNFTDALDLAVLIDAFNTAQGDSLFNPEADFNGDRNIDALDLALLIDNFNSEGAP